MEQIQVLSGYENAQPHRIRYAIKPQGSTEQLRSEGGGMSVWFALLMGCPRRGSCGAEPKCREPSMTLAIENQAGGCFKAPVLDITL